MAQHKWLLLFIVQSDLRKMVLPDFPQNIPTDLLITIEAYKVGFYSQVVHNELKKTTINKDIKIVIASNIRNVNSIMKSVTQITEYTENQQIVNSTLNYEPDWSFVDKNDITELLKIIKKEYPAENTAIFTYGHGSAFGIFKTAIQTINNRITENINNLKSHEKSDNKKEFFDKINEALKKDKYFSVTTKAFLNKAIIKNYYNNFLKPAKTELKGILKAEEKADSTDEVIKTPKGEEFEILANEELGQAIIDAFGHVDVVIMDNCLMQNVYTQYALKDSVSFFIAPLSGIKLINEDMIGYNITGWMDLLVSQSQTIKPAQFARVIVEAFESVSTLTQKDHDFEKFVISAVPLKDFDNTKKILDAIKDTCILLKDKLDKEQGFQYKIYNALKKCYGFDVDATGICTIVDFFEFVKALAVPGKFPDVENLLNSISNELILHSQKTPVFLGNFFNPPTRQFTGFNIYFPRNREYSSGIFNPYIVALNYISAFDTQTKWNDFLATYFKLTED